MMVSKIILLILIFTSISIALESHSDDDDLDNRDSFNCKESLEYDYIVLGAGTAGSVLASKLSDNKRNSVLLVEEGPFISGNQLIEKPDNWYPKIVIAGNKAITKDHPDVPQPGLNNRSIRNIRGKVVGGSGSVNAMVMVQASTDDFNDWAAASNNSDWSWNSISNGIPEFESRFDYFRIGTERNFFPELRTAIDSLGFQFINDTIKTGNLPGYHASVFMMRHNATNNDLTRISSYTQFVEKDLFDVKKSNLDVFVNERAEKLHFQDSTKRSWNSTSKNHVKGVFIRNKGTGKVRYIKVNKEVILSMGAFDTPKFLQLNGIGDRPFLESLGIQSIVHSPAVGQGLKDHLYNAYEGKPLHPRFNNTDTSPRNPIHDGFNIYGPANKTRPDYAVNVDIKDGKFICAYEMTRSTSNGYVELTSKNFDDKLIIDEKILQNDQDNQLYTAGLELCLQVQQNLVNQGILDETYQDPLHNATWSQLLEYTRSNAQLDFHPCCTVRMGKHNDISPLSPKLRVKGIDNLRVVDLSVLPTQTTMNPNTPLIFFALQASKVILNSN